MSLPRQTIDSSPLDRVSDEDCFACKHPQRHDIRHTCSRRRSDRPVGFDRRESRLSGASSFHSPGAFPQSDAASFYSSLPASQASRPDQTPLKTPSRFSQARSSLGFGLGGLAEEPGPREPSTPEDIRRGRVDRTAFEQQAEQRANEEAHEYWARVNANSIATLEHQNAMRLESVERELSEARERDRFEAATQNRIALEHQAGLESQLRRMEALAEGLEQKFAEARERDRAEAAEETRLASAKAASLEAQLRRMESELQNRNAPQYTPYRQPADTAQWTQPSQVSEPRPVPDWSEHQPVAGPPDSQNEPWDWRGPGKGAYISASVGKGKGPDQTLTTKEFLELTKAQPMNQKMTKFDLAQSKGDPSLLETYIQHIRGYIGRKWLVLGKTVFDQAKAIADQTYLRRLDTESGKRASVHCPPCKFESRTADAERSISESFAQDLIESLPKEIGDHARNVASRRSVGDVVVEPSLESVLYALQFESLPDDARNSSGMRASLRLPSKLGSKSELPSWIRTRYQTVKHYIKLGIIDQNEDFQDYLLAFVDTVEGSFPGGDFTHAFRNFKEENPIPPRRASFVLFEKYVVRCEELAADNRGTNKARIGHFASDRVDATEEWGEWDYWHEDPVDESEYLQELAYFVQDSSPEDVARAFLAQGKKGKGKGKPYKGKKDKKDKTKNDKGKSDKAGKGPANQKCWKCTDPNCTREGGKCKHIGPTCHCDRCKKPGHDQFTCWQRKENASIVPKEYQNTRAAHSAVTDQSFYEASAEGAPEPND